MDNFDRYDPPRCVSYLEASKTLPPGWRTKVVIHDQWNERRTVSKTFRADEDTDEAIRDVLREAVDYRDHVEEKSSDIRWLRRRFPEPKQPESIDFFELGDRVEKFAPDNSDPTLQDFVERGMTRQKDGRLVVDQKSTETGYLRRKKIDTSAGHFRTQKGIWSVVVEWGGIHDLAINEISGSDVDDFVRWMELQSTGNDEPRYSTSTIKGHRNNLRSMIQRFAIDRGERNPLDVAPPLKSPRQIKGKPKKRKCPTADEMTVIDEGFHRRVDNASDAYRPARELCREVYLLLRHSGLRPSEAYYLTSDHVNTIRCQIKVEGAINEGGSGPTKSARLGSENGTRIVPVSNKVVERIVDWIDRREDLGFPSIEEQPLIFCQPSGKPMTRDVLTHHFRKAWDAYQGDLDVEQRVTPYMIRHWRNDQLRRRGMPPDIRSKIIGHNVEINPRYTEINAEEARKWIED